MVAASKSAVTAIEQRLSEVEKMAAASAVVVEKISQTIDKLTDVSSNLASISAVQGNRLEALEKISKDLMSLIEKYNEKSEAKVEDIRRDMLVLREEIRDEIEKSAEKTVQSLKDELSSMRMEAGHRSQLATSDIDDLEDRVSKAERWMWFVSGGGVVVAALASLIIQVLLK